MWSTVLALAASERGDRRLWIAAGAVLGLSVFVHPTAPLYALTAFAASLFAPESRAGLARGVAGLGGALVTFVPYYVRTLHVLGDRYGVGSGAVGGRTFTGRPVWEDALHFVAPGRTTSTTSPSSPRSGSSRCCAGAATRARVLRADRCRAVVFFSVVPANGDSALFFDRYMIPATPGVPRRSSWPACLAAHQLVARAAPGCS